MTPSPTFCRGPVLGIETSCDETAVAIVQDGVVTAQQVSSQVPIHRRFGGVVPEVASRNHLLSILPVVQAALAEADVAGPDLAGIAVTNRPGLIGALLVGVQTAKTLALLWDTPLVAVDHIAAHCWAVTLRDVKGAGAGAGMCLPALALAVSGGHTSLLKLNGPGDMELLGATLDDAAGEALDKFGKLLGLPYPAGPEIERLARGGDRHRFELPLGMRGRDDLAMSFSGLKTAGRRIVDTLTAAGDLDATARRDLCASYQNACVRQLVAVTVRAAERSGLHEVIIAGGVAANQQLRVDLEQACVSRGWRCRPVPLRWCTDNGAMVAGLGSSLLAAGVREDPLALDALATLKRRPIRATESVR